MQKSRFIWVGGRGNVPKIDPEPKPLGQLVHDANVCTGCGICEMACSMAHDGVYSRALSRIKIHRNYYRGHWDGTGQYRADLCLQCPWPACMYACPVEAITIDPRTNARVIDEEVCIGCRRCQKACPYDVIVYDPVRRISVKCDLCGGDPECVKQCPASGNGAIRYIVNGPADRRGE
jgi:anaerobic carbon-monoxide dehydrogenase iron sulfur subunit